MYIYIILNKEIRRISMVMLQQASSYMGLRLYYDY